MPRRSTTSFTAQKTLFGWTGGVGTEWAWTPNWSIKSEVLYMRFASDDTMVTGSAPAGVTRGSTYRLGSQDSVWITRFGLNRDRVAAAARSRMRRFCGRLLSASKRRFSS